MMGLCGMLAFTHAGAYSWLHEQIGKHYPAIVSCLPGLIWGILFAFGFVTVILVRRGGGALTWLVVICSLPSILSFNSLDLLKIFSAESRITSDLTFWQAMSLGIAIITCYVLLSSMSVLKQSRLGLLRRQAPDDDIERINTRSHLFMLLICGISLTAALIIYFLADGIERLISGYLPHVPWYIVLISLSGILFLAVYLYWVGAHRRSKT
jgi:hypothetical protein